MKKKNRILVCSLLMMSLLSILTTSCQDDLAILNYGAEVKTNGFSVRCIKDSKL